MIKNFVEGMSRGRSAFKYIKMKFAEGSYAKIKEGAFVGPQIRQLIHDKRCNAGSASKTKHAMEFFQISSYKKSTVYFRFFFCQKGNHTAKNLKNLTK